MSELRVNTIKNSAGSGDPALSGGAKAWVNFNGTGTVAIRSSFNVTSITDNGTGDYRVNFTTAMPTEDYAVAGQASNSGLTASSGANALAVHAGFAGQLTGSVRVIQTSGSAADRDNMSVVVFA